MKINIAKLIAKTALAVLPHLLTALGGLQAANGARADDPWALAGGCALAGAGVAWSVARKVRRARADAGRTGTGAA